jgi:hypothetical protein
MTEPRPKAPIPVLPCRIITPAKVTITWHCDGYINKKYINGDTETWVPIGMVTHTGIFETISPSGGLHKVNYSLETNEKDEEGEIISNHLVDTDDDGTLLCWYNDCSCFNEYPEENSRCETLGFHVGCGECEICAKYYNFDD